MWNQKIAYVDLGTGKVETKYIPEEIRRKYLGMRGIDTYLLYNHIKPGIDPLGPENVLLVSSGPLAGTPVPSACRTHVSALSPLTECVGSTSMGNYFGPELRYAGFDHLVIKGKAEKPSYLWVHDGQIEVRDADYIWGQDCFEAQKSVKAHHGDEDVQVMTIGQAGENLVKYACVRTGLKATGGRTGMGCVMGSKNLKCIAVRGTLGVELFSDADKMIDVCYKLWKEKMSHRLHYMDKEIGRGGFFGNTNTIGLIRNKNFQRNQMVDGTDIEPENLDRFAIGRQACFACKLHCRFRFKLTTGPRAGEYAEGPDYTTLGTMGAELDNESMDEVLACGELCDKYGMDNMEIGSLLSWAIELYEKGIITIEDTEIPLEWDNIESKYEMIRRIAMREGFGDVLADGAELAIQRIGEESRYYCIQMKGMSNLHSDERPTPSLALNVAVSTRGPDHLRGRPIQDLMALPVPVLEKMYGGGPMSSNYNSYVGKARMVVASENRSALSNCLGTCGGIGGGGEVGGLKEVVYLVTGLKLTQEEADSIGERVYTLERMFNNRQGRGRKDDYLPDRYYDEPTPVGMPMARGKTIDRKEYDKMLDEYYEFHGWDSNGVPTPETLKRLDLTNEPSNLL
ncbi:MAG: aldehyde ferredoxin oxidoreductase family protein [Chloroflexi bacterium]|jgi:aldehyde:ferredoxin oxidoreductase|nr:aldehyde ferredoxin oxidoreductase family protein [Chloroflexota bacterium]MBT7082229.1 aldehyde ferredoxin oxidoreductase family protein [Chloroflexota bacterium]